MTEIHPFEQTSAPMRPNRLRHLTRRRIAASALVIATLSTVTAYGGSSGTDGKASSSPTPTASYPPAHFFHTGAYAAYGGSLKATGVSVEMTQAAPVVAKSDSHSLMEVKVINSAQDQVLGIGWAVGGIYPNVYTDGKPHFFVERLDKDNSLCAANDRNCGLISVPGASLAPGDVVQTGTSATYGINYDPGAKEWQVFYNHKEEGYWPDTLPGAQFNNVSYANAFGEIATRATVPCSQMGDGIPGNKSGSATISNFTLIDGESRDAAIIIPFSDTPYYSYGGATESSVRVGGTGAPSCAH